MKDMGLPLQKGDRHYTYADLFVVYDQEKIKENYCLGAPDWVAGVLSPSTSRKDIRETYDLYERNRVREYWIIDPYGRFVRVYRLKPEGIYAVQELCRYEEKKTVTIASTVLAGFTVTLREIFGER